MIDKEATQNLRLRRVEETRELHLMLLYYQRREAAQKNPDLLVNHIELEQQLAEKTKRCGKG